MRARGIRATWLVALAIIGLLTGLSLRDSNAQTTTAPAEDSVPAAQTDLVKSEPDTAAEPAPAPPTTEPGPANTTPTDTGGGPGTGPTGGSTSTTGGGPPAPTPTTPGAPQPRAPADDPGAGSAAFQSLGAKQAEAKASCDVRPVISPMIGVGSQTLGRPEKRNGGRLVAIVVIAALAAGVAAAALVRRLRRRSGDTATRKTLLDIVASSVAIVGTLGTFAVAYLGTGHKEHPPPRVTMTVREVAAGITNGAYSSRVAPGTTPRGAEAAVDRREIGHVVLLELHFTGYRDTTVEVRWLLVHDPGHRAIPGTARRTPLEVVGRADAQAQFVPIWVGSPRLKRFRVEFRLFAGGQVRQVAFTGPVRSIPRRYACPS